MEVFQNQKLPIPITYVENDKDMYGNQKCAEVHNFEQVRGRI